MKDKTGKVGVSPMPQSKSQGSGNKKSRLSSFASESDEDDLEEDDPNDEPVIMEMNPLHLSYKYTDTADPMHPRKVNVFHFHFPSGCRPTVYKMNERSLVAECGWPHDFRSPRKLCSPEAYTNVYHPEHMALHQAVSVVPSTSGYLCLCSFKIGKFRHVVKEEDGPNGKRLVYTIRAWNEVIQPVDFKEVSAPTTVGDSSPKDDQAHTSQNESQPQSQA
jgi:hypothetical protein